MTAPHMFWLAQPYTPPVAKSNFRDECESIRKLLVSKGEDIVSARGNCDNIWMNGFFSWRMELGRRLVWLGVCVLLGQLLLLMGIFGRNEGRSRHVIFFRVFTRTRRHRTIVRYSVEIHPLCWRTGSGRIISKCRSRVCARDDRDRSGSRRGEIGGGR